MVTVSAGISAPSDLTAPVVASQADSGKCTHNIVPNTGSVVSTTANNDLDVADTITVVRKCNYAGMPEGDMSIAAKSTIRRVFASALGRSSSNELASTAKLSQVAPFKYDASESGPHLLGKPMDVYGATSLLATTALAAYELKPGVTLSSALDMTSRTDWTREGTYAGKAFVIGQESSGMAAPLDISAIQRVIAVADATQIEVGDYLAVGDEMMYVESIDGNFVGVVRGAAGTVASSHKSLGKPTNNERDYEYLAETNAANGGGDRTAKAIDEVPATGWVTIWKKTTKSVYSTTSVNAATDIVPNEGTGAVAGGFADADAGYIWLVGGTGSKEFMADKTAGSVNLIDPVGATTDSTDELPFFATNAAATEIGESAVVYTCNWGTATSTSQNRFDTMGGVNKRDNLCLQTTLLGLPVIPVASTAGIKPGDYLRVDYPQFEGANDNTKTVAAAEEELYRVNAVMGNDLLVTHKPLADDHNTNAANVNRYVGGTNLDLLTYKKTVKYSAVDGGTGGILANTNSLYFTVDSSDGVQVGYYCLIDKEFMYISALAGTTVTIGAQGTPAAGSLAGNQGRSAFGTGVPGTGKAHPASGNCHVYEYKGGAGQATEPTRTGFGHTTIYDPRVSIRQIKKVDSSTSLLLGAKADTLTKTGSEPANVIGDPHEPFENANPVRSGADYGCPVVGGKVYGYTTATGVAAADSIARINGAFSATDTVLSIQVKDTALPTASLDLVVGDYIRIHTTPNTNYMRVTAIDTTASTITVDRTVDFMPGTSDAAGCLTNAGQAAVNDNEELYYVQHNCPTISVVGADGGALGAAEGVLTAAITATVTTVPVTNAATFGFAAGKYYQFGPEIMLVKEVNTNNLVVERNVQTIPCRPSTAKAFPTGTTVGQREVLFTQTNYATSNGEDLQIDSNLLKAGTAYMAGALGDMLEDVSRVTNDAAAPAKDVHAAGSPPAAGADTNSNPLAGLLGGGATSYFASPWGKGGNVTDFCYAAGSRSTTVKTKPGTATTGTSDTMQVNSLDALGAVVGDYIQVTAATATVTPGVGEYMMVTAIAAGTSTLTVIRNVAPNCLGYTNKDGVDAAANSVVTLLKPVFDTVQLVDSVTKQATQAAGADGNPVSSGECAVVGLKVAQTNDGGFAQTDNFLTFDAGVGAANGVETIEVGGEYMLVTGKTIGAAGVGGVATQTTGTLTVVRDVAPPCLGIGAVASHNDNVDIKKVVTGGCYAMPGTVGTTLANGGTTVSTTAKSFIATANTNMQVGGYLFIDAEYMLITDIDATTITVERNVVPPCVISTTTLTSTLATHASNANVFILSLSGSNNMISTSMRAIVELSPREPIVWAPVAPALPPSAFYVDVKVGVEYSEAEFATKSAAFTRAMSALTGVAVESTTVSYSAARRASGNVNARSYVLSQAKVTALLKKLGADTDTCACGSSCQKALLDGLNEKLVAEGLKPATSAEIVFNDQCKPKKKSDDNLLLLLLLLLLIPIGAAAVYWCCKQEPAAVYWC